MRLTYTNITATVALFVAIGGTSYAATTITGRDIRNGSVTGSDLKNETVRSRDVDNGSLTGSDFKTGSLTASDVDDEALRAADVKPGQAPAGPPGLPGPQGTTGATVRRAVDVLLTLGQTGEATASCASGEVAVGGGAGHDGPVTDFVAILADEPLAADGDPPAPGEPATKWHAIGQNLLIAGPPQSHMRVYVLCANGS